MGKKKIALLGSTGSIGRQVLNCVDRFSDRYEIVSLAANENALLLQEQANKYKPKVIALSNGAMAHKVTSVPFGCKFYFGENAPLHAVLEEADVVFVAIMGFAGLNCVLEAIRLKKTVAIANKETLVAGGEIVTELAKENGVELIPVDSEHSALWQSLFFDKNKPFERLIITASGGAFRNLPISELEFVTAKDALKHPNWNMGKKITVDCATMVNKGLEVIEARWLFNAPYDKISVLMHPESIVHSMVEYVDGAIMAQLGYPSMEVPISLALSYPERLFVPDKVDLVGKTLHFDSVDYKRYPCFKLVLDCAKLGGGYPCALSAANELAVSLFLDEKIKFTEIYDYISCALDSVKNDVLSYESLKEIDVLARRKVLERFKIKNS